MAYRENKCQGCGKYIGYDDQVQNQPRCPTCHDPNAVYGITYRKSTILSRYRMYLEINGIEVESFDVEQLLALMSELHPVINTFYSGIQYPTFTIRDETPFLIDPNYIIGEFKVKANSNGRLQLFRIIRCNRCGSTPAITKFKTLTYFLGLMKKLCRKCDNTWRVLPEQRRQVTHSLGGRTFDPNSEREKAKQLNVSLSDYRRGNLTPQPALPAGTILRGYRIEETYYDEKHNIYQPKYLVRCIRCPFRASIQQRSLPFLNHQCQEVQ